MAAEPELISRGEGTSAVAPMRPRFARAAVIARKTSQRALACGPPLCIFTGQAAVGFEGLSDTTAFSVEGSMGMVRGWRIARQGQGRRAVVYLHGNAGNVAVEHRVKLYRLLRAPPLCCDVIAVDYCSFGASDGWWPDETSACLDALAVLSSLSPQISMANVVLWGHSLGTGVAVATLAKLVVETSSQQGPGRLPRGLVLEAPFTSLADVGASFVPPCRSGLHTLLRMLVRRARFLTVDSVELVAQELSGRVAVLHGVYDCVVPLEQGEKVAREARASLHVLKRGHDDIVDDPDLAPLLETQFALWGL